MRYACIAMMTLFATIGVANADLWQFDVTLDGLQEAPPSASPGTGAATAILNDITGDVTINGTFQDLLGTTTASHLHGYAGAGVNAGVIFPLAIEFGVTSGVFNGADVIPAGNIADVLGGLTYINVHTSVVPGGEIRGQLVDPVRVPEPGSLLLLGLLTLSGMRRR